jgi:hypothetical protein
MNWPAAILIFVMAVVSGLVLYLPFFIWFRWRSYASRKRGDSARGFRVTRFGACLYGVTLAAVFAGLGSGQLAPESWLGAQVRTLFGAFGFVSAVCVATSAIERFFLKRGIVFAYDVFTSNVPSEQAADGSNNA